MCYSKQRRIFPTNQRSISMKNTEGFPNSFFFVGQNILILLRRDFFVDKIIVFDETKKINSKFQILR